MVNREEVSAKVEWRISVPDGKTKILVAESGPLLHRAWLALKGLVEKLILKTCKFMEKAWNLGVADPKKVIHGLKVGLALTLVSLFYYMRPLYDGMGGNAMWAVMTVVVVFESTVGATLCKCINRGTGTFLAGALGIGVHWIASQSGENFEPIILGISVFLLASAATFSRFIPTVKARFDYGAMIFILTFSLVSVSGYRVDELFEMAQQRLSTIAIGASLCVFISMLFCPIWAGNELHQLIHRNLEKLADSLDGCVADYFKENGTETTINKEDLKENMRGYRCVLNSKGAEESMAQFARWEPAHGCFGFQHPWKQYLKIGASMRSCACCIEALNGCVGSDIKAPEYLSKQFSNACMTLRSHSSSVLKELAVMMKTMTKSSNIEILVGKMKFALQELKNGLKSVPNNIVAHPERPEMLAVKASSEEKEKPVVNTAIPPLMEVLPLATLASLLIEIAERVEGIVDAVDELAGLAEFKPATDKQCRQKQPTTKTNSDSEVQ